MLAALTPEIAPGIDGPITGAADSIVQTGVLGALVILLMAVAVAAVLKWNKTNEARVKDQKEMAKALVDITSDVKDAVRELTGMTDALKEALKANTTAVTTMERTVNEVVREAIRKEVR
jgi:F0F1-type ATP synthase membrane subunit b/b'